MAANSSVYPSAPHNHNSPQLAVGPLPSQVYKSADSLDGGGDQGAMEHRRMMEVLIQRLDRLTQVVSRSSAGHYQRAYVAM